MTGRDKAPSIYPACLATTARRARAAGESYQGIADDLGFSIAAVWKWCRRWEREGQAS